MGPGSAALRAASSKPVLFQPQLPRSRESIQLRKPDRAPLRTIYDLFIRTLRIVVSNDLGVIPGNVSGAGIRDWRLNVRDSDNDGGVHGKCRILCAIPGGTMQGVQASFDRLLGPSATRLGRRHDS